MSSIYLSSAIEDFRKARQQAILKEIVARLKGEPITLLSYDEVRQQLRATNTAERGLQEIPINAIVGSVNRYSDFTRDFLPRENINAERWARVEQATYDPTGLPPIEVYQIGQVYFVKDGNHRVSVAKQLGAVTIQAYVTEVRARVNITPEMRPEEIILKAEYADFLERTHIDEIRPEADLILTEPGQYPALEEHISVHRYYMGLEQKREIPYEEGVAHWYDTVYRPIQEIIRENGIMQNFPGRTEADLYLWIAEHRAELEKTIESDIKPEDAAQDLADEFSPRAGRIVARLGSKIKDFLLPDSLESGPPPGAWRQNKLANTRHDRLFSDILVPVNGRETGWNAVRQALILAQREHARLHGLHIVPTQADKDNPDALGIQEEFKRLCFEAHIPGALVIAAGEVSRVICERARWNDLIVINLDYPPASHALAALTSSLRAMIQRCPKPILTVPQKVSQLNRAILAYDGSPKAREALFVSTYIAGKWRIPLTVVYATNNELENPNILKDAQEYLDTRQVKADYRIGDGPAADVLLKIAEEQNCDLIIMGGYSRSPLLDVVFGSSVNEVLRSREYTVLICR